MMMQLLANMRGPAALAAGALLLPACGDGRDAPAAPPSEAARNGAVAQSAPSPGAEQPIKPEGAGTRWELRATEGGITLELAGASGSAAIRLACPVRPNVLLVNVPGFRPIGSEERLSFGSNGDAIALVADTRGDPQRGGVTAKGSVPTNLAALIGGDVSASYGSQVSGPHPAPPGNLAQRFAAACYERLGVPAGQAKSAAPLGPCRMQGDERLLMAPLRAVGTEPFWAAQIEGRCVTYSHPEDQEGTRVWTRYTPATGGGGTWVGALEGQPFELRTRPRPGCSDGMSDRRYPYAVELIVNGERRSGCAAPVR